MLVCNVSLRPPRSAIAAEIAEVVAAADTLGTGNVVFATLVDDPASVGETVDAYLGEIMIEAASAADTLSTGNIYDGDVAEAATASSTQDASVPILIATLDGTQTNVTMSGGNLIATLNAAVNNSGAVSASFKATGKYYFEMTITTNSFGSCCEGILLSTGTLTNFVTNGTNCMVYFPNGPIYANGNSGKTLGSVAVGDVIGVAVDLGASKGWMRKNAGNWNGDATHNPATGAGGIALVASGSYAPAVGFGLGNQNIGDKTTANFGQSAFINSVPSGFGNWPA